MDLSTYLSQFPSSSGGFLSIVIRYSDSVLFQPFWLPQLPVTGEQASSSNKKIIARVIFVISANKYTELRTYLSFFQVMMASNSGYQWYLTTRKRHF